MTDKSIDFLNQNIIEYSIFNDYIIELVKIITLKCHFKIIYK